MRISGFIGIDAGTQGLSATFTDEAMRVIAIGEGGYRMVPDLPDGCYEQRPADWWQALETAFADLRGVLKEKGVQWDVRAIGIAGQMHGAVLADAQGHALAPARLWCDARNDAEGEELTALLGVKMPKRITAARWLWTVRHQPEWAARTAHLTTPGGWLAYQLTGEWNLGVGDASGMFPIDARTLDYHAAHLCRFDEWTAGQAPALSALLPSVRRAGADAGVLQAAVAERLGVPPGIPVAAAEGDQPAALAGSLVGESGTVALSLGTSVCANAIGDRVFEGVHPGIDHFCAADGKPINMVCLRNGTTYFNTIVSMFADVMGGDRDAGFAAVKPLLLAAPPDCGGLLALPFMDDEPGVSVSRGGTALLLGLNAGNAKPGYVAKAALLATLFNLRLGLDELHRQGYPGLEIAVSGGLMRERGHAMAGFVADALGIPTVLRESATEGTGWGAALLAKYRRLHVDGPSIAWSEFLTEHETQEPQRFVPDTAMRSAYDEVYGRYRQLLAVQPALQRVME